ncbi:hypothetical protein BX666DRAFT_1071305 [Dichotomocladium elegans]|nr:hypothetical protein BX666DRAFT_1071305 [Dichotomocladium elegans]
MSNTNSPTQPRAQLTPTRSGSLRRSVADDRNELERINFQLREQVKDLKYQLAGKTNELTKIQQTLATRTSEHDEKMKKMREIFAQATKNLDGYRASIAAKDAELGRLRDDLDQAQAREQHLRADSETKKREAEKLNSELNSRKALYGSQIKQLEIKVKHLSVQLQETKTEYDQYKKRASQLLQKNANGQNDLSARQNELEETIKRLQLEKSTHTTSRNRKQSTLQGARG